MNGAEGASGLDQLHQFGVAGEKPLGTEETRESRFEGKRGAGGIEVEDGGAGGGDDGKESGGWWKPRGGRGNRGGEGRAGVG